MSESTALLDLPAHEPGDEGATQLPPADAFLATSAVDLDLALRVGRALQATGYGALRNVGVGVRAGDVTLTGCVPTYYMKQVAQSAALAVPGVRQFCNSLDVGRLR